MRILVIDDCKEDRELISKYIKTGSKNIIIEESDCLYDGMMRINNTTYDAILLDLALPETDGLQTIKKIKSEIKKEIPIIILTGLEDYQLGKEAFAMGIADFLIKGEVDSKALQRSITFATYNNKNISHHEKEGLLK